MIRFARTPCTVPLANNPKRRRAWSTERFQTLRMAPINIELTVQRLQHLQLDARKHFSTFGIEGLDDFRVLSGIPCCLPDYTNSTTRASNDELCFVRRNAATGNGGNGVVQSLGHEMPRRRCKKATGTRQRQLLRRSAFPGLQRGTEELLLVGCLRMAEWRVHIMTSQCAQPCGAQHPPSSGNLPPRRCGSETKKHKIKQLTTAVYSKTQRSLRHRALRSRGWT